jgi:hypothetical protein
MSGASLAHVKAMHRTMKYCVGSPGRCSLLKPIGKWDGNPSYEFVITGRSDSDYAKDTDTRRSVSGTSTFLNGSPILKRSNAEECDIVGDGSQASRCDAMRAGYALVIG